MILQTRHDELLNAIEEVERQSLMWGDVEGSISVDEARELAEPLFGDGAEEALEALIDTALLLPFDVRGEERYRSRFAEAVRLLSRARQTFEREPWRGSPPLVADFRVDLRRRRYPKRKLPRSDVLETFGGFTDLQRAVWMAVAPAGLAAFQVAAVTALVAGSDGDRGAIVTAGTGSGKTLAFYLPAFLRLAELIEKGSSWTKGVAIYPRNELLKDQLTEAYRNAGLCGDAFREAKGRPIRLGTFYGDTPAKADPDALPKNWVARGQDRLCPFLRCDCGSEMVWTKADLEAKRERLTCRTCGKHSDEDRLALTRESVRRSPPDLLFTTTEMLNRSLSDPRRWEVFGVNQRKGRRPRFLLLDEAHTYAGVSGAQAALTLRRWRALHGGPLTWIGLSATLAEAPRFFSDLTGMDQSRIDEIKPAEKDFEEEGREYQVAVRGDPASRASLLSTSIQALMLVGRTMDASNGLSQGRFGRRVFAFTDDLDVTHRLFDNLRDAEAYDRFGKADGGRKPLAAMRAQVIADMTETEGDRRAREAAGQRWRMPERIGRNLGERLVIGRTTARDPGVDGRADIIVATSALEVGFNDPTVGAVVQHKAPRNFASFLQRRGRAGRNRTMRPLTLTVLSDYGRDRQAFQNYEYLFDPGLSPQSLPVRNQYVLRMQAAFALLDWLAQQPRPSGVRPASVWSSASRPLDPGADRGWTNHLRDTVGRLVRGDPDAVGGFTVHLRQGLGIDEATVQRLLWEPPRSILLEVAPTLASRLLRNWKLAWAPPDRVDDRWIADHPIPDFVPRALFSDLNLPEVEIVLPPARRTDEETFEALPIQQALSQLAPGRVTRRFGDVYGGLAHWFAVPAGIDRWALPVSDFAEHSEFVGPFRSNTETSAPWVNIYRPWRIRLQKANATEVEATSNAQLTWDSSFEPNGSPLEIVTPPRTAWRGLVDNVHLYLQQYRASVSVRRGALGARAEIRRPFGVQQVVDIAFVDDAGAPAALGYAFETDGLSIDLNLPPDESLSTRRFAPELERGLRAGYLRRLVHDDPGLPRECNGFQRAWLRQIHLLAAASRGLRNRCSLAEASRQIAVNGDVSVYEAVMDVLLGVQREGSGPETPSLEDDDDVDEGPSSGRRQRPDRLDRLRKDLAARLSDANVRSGLASTLAEALVTGESWGRFIRTTSECTLAEALISAVTSAAPRHAATDDLVVDIHAPADEPRRVTLWLTETTVGGAGVLQAVAEPFAREPRALFRAMEAALEPSDLELASAALAQAYRICGEDQDVASLVDAAREEVGHGARSRTRAVLLGALRDRGMEVGRAFVVSLNARMLAHSMRREHDDLVRALLAFWDRIEATLGLELDPKEIAVLAAIDTDLRQFAERAGIASAAAKAGEVATAMAALLWPRTNVLRRDNLTSYNPFRRGVPSDPALVRALLLDGADEVVDLGSPDWTGTVVARLAEMGAVRVFAPSNRPDLLRSAIVGLAATAVTVGHLVLYPTLERVSREAERTVAGFVLREQL